MGNLIGRLALCSTLFLSAAVMAQEFPAKPVRFVLGFGAGGPTDLGARALAEQMGPRLGQPIVVENKPGAAGIIASDYVVAQPADGYTLMFTGSNFSTFPIAYKQWKLDAAKDFTYLGISNESFVVMATSPSLPAKSLQELIAWAAANPGKLNVADVGFGPWDFVVKVLDRQHNWQMTRINYKTSGESKIAAMRGDVHVYFDGLNSSISEIKDGRVRGIAMISGRRAPAAMDIPTIAEAGLTNPRLDIPSWTGIVGPANIPADAVTKISRALKAAVESREYSVKAAALGNEAKFTPPEGHRELVLRSIETYSRLARELNIQPQ
jgi:tripartite-type tricarboxylate transporter receptor subunit TctC